MSTEQTLVEDTYAVAFAEYVDVGGERSLRAAYELGREAVRQQLSVLELGGIHHRALALALRHRADPAEVEAVTRSAAEFFLEALSAFEMVQRGFWEATERARLEKNHAEQLRQLAEASLAVNATLSLQGVLQVLADRSRAIIGARFSVARAAVASWPEIVSEATSPPDEAARWRAFLDLPATRILEWLGSPSDLVVRFGEKELRGLPGWDAVASAIPPTRDGLLAALLTDRGGRAIGIVHLLDKVDGEFTDNDESLLAQLAQIASVAIENAHLYERERQIAETLQRSLLPDQLPEIPGVTVAARYLPGGVGVQVGGDWYDVIQVGEGRVGVAVGDVVGRGATAAALMGQVRTAFRACALAGDPPQVVVNRLDALLQAMGSDHFSTMVYLILDPASGQLQMVRAGHPPPLMMGPDGRTRFLKAGHGVPLGAFPGITHEGGSDRLEPGSILVLYTDGLVESGQWIDEGSEQLERSLRGIERTPKDLDAVCQRLLSEMIGEEPADDVALLVLRLG